MSVRRTDGPSWLPGKFMYMFEEQIDPPWKIIKRVAPGKKTQIFSKTTVLAAASQFFGGKKTKV